MTFGDTNIFLEISGHMESPAYLCGTQEMIREVNMRLRIPVPTTIVTPEDFFGEEE